MCLVFDVKMYESKFISTLLVLSTVSKFVYFHRGNNQQKKFKVKKN